MGQSYDIIPFKKVVTALGLGGDFPRLFGVLHHLQMVHYDLARM